MCRANGGIGFRCVAGVLACALPIWRGLRPGGFAAEIDGQERYPTESIEAIKEAGLYGIWVPEEYGGSDMGCLALALAAEEVAWACAATATQYVDQPLGGLPILYFGTDEQKKKYL